MIVFIEGPDNVGKGTQIDNIWKEMSRRGMIPFWAHYTSFGIKEAWQCENFSRTAYWAMHMAAMDLHKRNMHPIFDRSIYGEWVYGKIYRGYDAYFIWEMEGRLKDDNYYPWQECHLITFIDDPENLIKRDDGLSFSTDLDKKRFEVNRFVEAHSMSRIPNKMLCNINRNSKEEVWSEVKDFLFS